MGFMLMCKQCTWRNKSNFENFPFQLRQMNDIPVADIFGKKKFRHYRPKLYISRLFLGWLVGFISKQDASQRMLMSPNPTFLLRFSDTQTGAVSIGFVCEEDGVKGRQSGQNGREGEGGHAE